MKHYKLLFLLLIITACDSDDFTNVEFRQYTGDYKITSFKSDLAVDLNNNNVTSNELISEIVPSNDLFTFRDLRISPNGNESNEKKLVSFAFPKTFITFKSPCCPEGRIRGFHGYGFLTTYEFENNTFILEDKSYIEYSYIDNMESNRTVHINGNLSIIDINNLKLTISKEFYDFNSNDWVMLNIEVKYEKI